MKTTNDLATLPIPRRTFMRRTVLIAGATAAVTMVPRWSFAAEQANWRRCDKCQGMFFAGSSSQGVCPADRQYHDSNQSSHYVAIFGDDAPGQQGRWRWCDKCQGMFFAGSRNQGVCPADSQSHDSSHSGHYAVIFGDDAPGQQGGWRWCFKCQGMFFAGNPSQGVCPADNQRHDSSHSGHYAFTLAVAAKPSSAISPSAPEGNPPVAHTLSFQKDASLRDCLSFAQDALKKFNYAIFRQNDNMVVGRNKNVAVEVVGAPLNDGGTKIVINAFSSDSDPNAAESACNAIGDYIKGITPID